MSPCPCLNVHVSMSPCLHFYMCPCVHVSMCPCVHVSMSPCLYVSISICPFLYLHVSKSSCHFSTFLEFCKLKMELTENGNFRLCSANGKPKRQTSVCLLQMELENARLISMVANDNCSQWLLFQQTCSSMLLSLNLMSWLFCTLSHVAGKWLMYSTFFQALFL
jgi:hypothetical protein